jgi:hypothetical protein
LRCQLFGTSNILASQTAFSTTLYDKVNDAIIVLPRRLLGRSFTSEKKRVVLLLYHTGKSQYRNFSPLGLGSLSHEAAANEGLRIKRDNSDKNEK